MPLKSWSPCEKALQTHLEKIIMARVSFLILSGSVFNIPSEARQLGMSVNSPPQFKAKACNERDGPLIITGSVAMLAHHPMLEFQAHR